MSSPIRQTEITFGSICKLVRKKIKYVFRKIYLCFVAVRKFFAGHFYLYFRKRKKYFPEPALRKHAYSVGQSGAGKSEIQKPIMYDLERRSRKKNYLSIGLIDPHGDLAQETLFF